MNSMQMYQTFFNGIVYGIIFASAPCFKCLNINLHGQIVYLWSSQTESNHPNIVSIQFIWVSIVWMGSIVLGMSLSVCIWFNSSLLCPVFIHRSSHQIESHFKLECSLSLTRLPKSSTTIYCGFHSMKWIHCCIDASNMRLMHYVLVWLQSV